MTRPRGRPASGGGVARNTILDAAMQLMDEAGGKGLTMRALARRLGVTPMSLYHHVDSRTGLLVALSDRVYGSVLQASSAPAEPRAEIRTLMISYYDAVGRHPLLVLEIFAEPEALIGATCQITDRLTALLVRITAKPLLWRDILVDHAHGSGLALSSAGGDQQRADQLRRQYVDALDCLLARTADA